MGNSIDYLVQNGKFDLEEKPFNDVDSLILCQLSYLKFEGMVPLISQRKRSVKLMDIFTHPLREQLFLDKRYELPNRRLFEAVAFSRRFQTMKLNYFYKLIDLEKQIQFAAVTFFLEDGTNYVAFRGTDETIVGWKEDFNMALKTPIPSQRLALEYMNKVAKRFMGNFMVGGHSKGGNLSVYSSMYCKDDIKKRIVRIYTNDGPGFFEDIFCSKEYQSIQNRIIKIVPQSSLIGMLFQHVEDYQVIASSGKGGIGQHDPYTWEVKDFDFVRKTALKQGRKRFNNRLNRWVEGLNEEEKNNFVETLYQIISVTEAETLLDLTEEWKENSLKILNAMKELDSDTRKMMTKVIGAMFRINQGKK